MALITANRVYDTSTTTGTGALTLSGSAPTGFRTFSAVMSTNDTCYYAVSHQTANEWEVGVGTYSSTNTLTRTTVIASSNSNSAVSFSAGTKNVYITMPSEKVVQADASGNVGIGTSSPGSKLEVTGTITVKSSGYAYNQFNTGLSSTASGYIATFNSSGTRIGYSNWWDGSTFRGAWTDGATSILFGTNDVERMRLDTAGRVLIGTSTYHTVPGTNTVEANGGMWAVVTSGQAAIGLYNTTAAHVGLYMFEASGYAGFATIDNAGAYSSNPMNFDSTGKVGIGTSAPGYALDVNGTVHYTTLTASSDRRFKKNITPISNALASIQKLSAIRFEWNEFVNARRSGYELNKPTFGVIAQDVKEVFPELVTQWKLSDDCQDALSVNYEKLVPVLLAALQELAAEVEKLKARES
jgi:hypothetical protein